MAPTTDEIAADVRWFAHRYHTGRDEIHFAWIPAEQQRALTFLGEACPAATCVVPRFDLASCAFPSAPLHLIVHSGLGGSTFLARALSQPGIVTTLKEPPILTDVVAHRIGGASRPDNEGLLRLVAALLARPFDAAETIVVKLSSVGNGLALEIAADRPDTRILCLQTPLERMLASLAARGPEGRIGGRRLFVGLRNSRMVPFAITDDQVADLSDLQLAAMAWLSIQAMFAELAKSLGSERVRGVGSERLISDVESALTAIAAHFKLELDSTRMMSSANRHAKTGEAFDAAKRAEHLDAIFRAHREELQAIVDWTTSMAEAAGIPLGIPSPLLD